MSVELEKVFADGMSWSWPAISKPWPASQIQCMGKAVPTVNCSIMLLLLLFARDLPREMLFLDIREQSQLWQRSQLRARSCGSATEWNVLAGMRTA